jgi:hypothetical protein
MNSSRIIYTPRPDATPQGEVNVLADAYRFILFEAKKSKEGGASNTTDNGKEIGDVPAKQIIPG